MPYQLSDQDISGFYRDGHIVFRAIVPPALIRDLRREADKAAAVARRLHGPQVQRLQPLGKYGGEFDLAPFRDYCEIPEVHDALRQLLGRPQAYSRVDRSLGLLIEPLTHAYCTEWHRDITQESSRLSEEEYRDLMLDWECVNQVNCPLYDDDCTWFVPGSHLRSRDLAGEIAATVRPQGVDWDCRHAATDPVAIERACADYTARMPGAVQLRLNAGDFAVYRPIGWHAGNYVPYRKRATLHDNVMTPRYEAWWDGWRRGGSPRFRREEVAV